MDDLFSYAAKKAELNRRRTAKDSNSRPETSRDPLTVSEINQRAKQLLEHRLGRVAVVGEISGAKRGGGGHWYLSLKDEASQLPAVMFRREASRLRLKIENGLQVVAYGQVTLYPNYGRYQMMIDRLEPVGLGAKQAAFEKLKADLQTEGLFDADRKRALPLVPRRVGVVTSASGAVIRDIVNVAQRRFPDANLLLVPCSVQGAESAGSIARAIRRASRLAGSKGLEVLIVGRGGGSLDDLWGFNDERVAREIYRCPVPVVSAVGHETDFTIADFVADVRAPTPSAAAELVFPIARELRTSLRRDCERSGRALRRRIDHERQRMISGRLRLGDAQSALREYAQTLNFAHERIERALRGQISDARTSLERTERRLEGCHPRTKLRSWRNRCQTLNARIEIAGRKRFQDARSQIELLGARLHALSPLAVLERGYSIVLDSKGRALRDSALVATGDQLRVRLRRGALDVEVKGTVEVCGD